MPILKDIFYMNGFIIYVPGLIKINLVPDFKYK